MGSRHGSALCVVLVCAALGTPQAAAGPFEGEWVGAFKGRTDWVFMRVRLGGEDTVPSGRVDLPLNGQRGVLLRDLRYRGDRLSFQMPASGGHLVFDGKLDANGIHGVIRQGFSSGVFELIRLARLSSEGVASLLGDYELGPDRTVLLYQGPQGLAYVDYRTGRMGHLYPIDTDTFVSGPTLLSVYPIDLQVTVNRDAWGSIVGLTWAARGQAPVQGRRTLRYRTDEVSYESGDVRIGASLLMPARQGPFPAVVMIHGSGAVGRGALMPIADALARNGIAVLVPDKRGVGASTGDCVRATFDDLANDALAGVAFLKSRVDIDPARIGLQGASLGGWVAPLAATRSGDVRFVIVEAAPMISPVEHERRRVEYQMRADGFPPEAIAQALAFMTKKEDIGRTRRGWNSLVRIMEKGRTEGWLGYVNPPSSLDNLLWHWTHVMSYDPLPVLEKLTCPVLALYGELDTIVSATFNRERLEKALAMAGNRDLTVRVFPKANHNFFAALNGGPGEIPRLRGFVSGYLTGRIDWLRARVAEPARQVPPVVAAAEGIDLDALGGGPSDSSPRP